MSSLADLRRMRSVLEIARSGSITNAAETLGLTQSALSRSIAELEASLGVQIFQRLPRGIELTPAGLKFVAGAKQILGDVENLLALVKTTQEGIAGRLRLGVAPSGYVAHASRALKALARTYPAVAIEVTTGSTQDLCPRFLNGQFDLMLGSSSYFQRWRELEVKPVKRCRFGVVMRADHPLTQLNRPPTETEILSYPVIMVESVEAIYSDLALRYAHHGLPPFQPQYVVEDNKTVGRLMLATDAVYPYQAPDFSAIQLDRFSIVEGVVDVPPHFVAIAYVRSRPRSAAAGYLERLIAQSLGADTCPKE